MTVNHDCLAAILSRPVVSNGQAKFVCLASGFAVHREVTNFSRAAALHLFFHSCMRDYEFSVIQHVVAHQIVDESGHFVAKLRRFFFELFERVGKSVGNLDIAASQFPH